MVDLRYEEPRCIELPSVVSPPNDWVAVNRRAEILYIYRQFKSRFHTPPPGLQRVLRMQL